MTTTPPPSTPSPPPAHLLCSICRDVFEDPHTHGCGLHAFCRGCLESLAAARAERDARSRATPPGDAACALPCPHCRRVASFDAVSPADAVRAELASRTAACACGARVPLVAFRAHARACDAAHAAERRARNAALARGGVRAFDRPTDDDDARRHHRRRREDEDSQDHADEDDDERRHRRRSEDHSSSHHSSSASSQDRRRRPSSSPSSTSGYVNRSTFTCPVCVREGGISTGAEDHPGCHLDADALLRHLDVAHDAAVSPVRAVCPVCVAQPWGDPSIAVRDLAAHVRWRHGFEYAAYVDVEEDEEDALRRALEASAAEVEVEV
jgi:hypothetical protein